MSKRILVISHNVFSQYNNMGRTLESIFSGWDKSSIAQIYFSEEVPSNNICEQFFKITDSQVFKSVFSHKTAGKSVTQYSSASEVVCLNGIKKKITKIARYRTPSIYCARNFIWKKGKWKSPQLNSWIEDFNPEIVYYASGDYAFSYEVALYISQKQKIPLIISCVDDFYIGKRKTINPLYYINHRYLMKYARLAFSYASTFTGICEAMTRDYSELFSKHGYTIYTPTTLDINNEGNRTKEKKIVYAGNLGYGRAEQLIFIGKALKKLNNPIYPYIHVYSGEIRTEITNKMSKDNGIIFHGSVTADKIPTIIKSSTIVIHTESFKTDHQIRVRYSVSTKIADYLASGTCILGFGSSKVASIDYLKENKAAFIIDNPDQIESGLIELLSNESLRKKIIESAKSLANKNHNIQTNQKMIENIVEEVLNENTTS